MIVNDIKTCFIQNTKKKIYTKENKKCKIKFYIVWVIDDPN